MADFSLSVSIPDNIDSKSDLNDVSISSFILFGPWLIFNVQFLKERPIPYLTYVDQNPKCSMLDAFETDFSKM
jgi:hypothetical protein